MSKRALQKQLAEEDERKSRALDELEVIPASRDIILGDNDAMKSLISRASKSRLTTGAHIRVAELNHDPIAFAVKVIKGEALTENHPYLTFILDCVASYYADIEAGKPVLIDDLLDRLVDKAKEMLTDSWTPSKLRIDANKDLLKYLYPTLKAVDHSGTVNHNHTHIAVLQEQEVATFKKKFNDEY